MFPRSAGHDPARSATFHEAAATPALCRGDGLRRAVSAADPSDRPQLPQGPEQRARRRARRSGQPVGDRRRGGRPHGGRPGSARSRTSIDSSPPRARHGLEIALDIAFQASPDHPYVKEHPEWFRHRPDGTIKYAENPPKKYQDIYPFDFESDDWQALWHELKRVIRVLDRARREDLPRRQSAHQAVPVLGVGDRRDQTRSIPTRSSWPKRSPGRR